MESSAHRRNPVPSAPTEARVASYVHCAGSVVKSKVARWPADWGCAEAVYRGTIVTTKPAVRSKRTPFRNGWVSGRRSVIHHDVERREPPERAFDAGGLTKRLV